ncbi:MAG TPA: FAD-dependent oxidoreductase [Planctomycetota bacterium]
MRACCLDPLRVEVPGENYHRDLISCQRACPVHTDARGYIRAIASGDFHLAYLIARGPNPFASICGRICGAPCETACRRGQVPRVDEDGRFVAKDRPISIRALKRFVCDQSGPEARSTTAVLDDLRRHVPPVAADAEEMAALLRAGLNGRIVPAAGQRVAIIGAGPAGLSAAHDLALLGFKPVVFETEPVPAGMLIVGVPAYRLPRELIAREIDVIRQLGVEIRCNVTVGKDVSLAALRKEYAGVIIAVGAKSSRGLGLPGERGPRVYGGVDLLRAVALSEKIDLGREVVVIGGGNVAYDVARTVLRQIAYDTARTAARQAGVGKVHLVSLETLEEMPADTVEIVEGDEEGIERHNGWGPLEIVRNPAGAVTGTRFKRCLRVYDKDRKFSPAFDEADQQIIPCDTVLLSVGQAPNLSFLQDGGSDIEQFRPGWPKVDKATLQTTASGVFVAGDLAHGTRLMIDAIASGKQAARSVYAFVTGRKLDTDAVTAHIPLPQYRREPGYESIRRASVPTLEPHERLKHPETVVEQGFGREQAMREASRCLDCGVTPVFDGSRCVLCGGCVDVCPTKCLKLVPVADLTGGPELDTAIAQVQESRCPEVEKSAALNAQPQAADSSTSRPLDCSTELSAMLKDEDRCIRCALCAMRCPVEAIEMERVSFRTDWRSA